MILHGECFAPRKCAESRLAFCAAARRRAYRILYFAVAVAACISMTDGAPAALAADNAADANARIVAWAAANIGAYNQYTQYARQKTKPQVPVPPMVDPPCHVCGDTSKTQGEQQVDAWVQQSQEPEATYIKGLLQMDKQATIYRSQGNLSPEASHALNQFEGDAGFMADAGKLADRLLNDKAIPMAQNYDSEPRQAYAGIKFLLTVTRATALIQGWSSSNSEEDRVIDLARIWTQSIADKIDKDVTSGHKYNLCPVYASIYRQVELLGGPSTDMAKFEQTIQKLQGEMKFNVTSTLDVKTRADDGGHLNGTWVGKSKLTLKLDLAYSCYTPQFDNGGQITVDVTNFDSAGIKHNPDGSVTQVPVELTSPHHYTGKLGTPQLNLCDPEPVFQYPAVNATSTPQEMVTAGGHTQPAALYGSFLSGVVGANEVNAAATNAVTGGAPSLPGSSPSSSQGTDTSGLDQARAQIEAHKGDVSWLMSPAGQAAIASAQKQALAIAQSKMAAKGVVIPHANTAAQLASTLASAHLRWTNGQAEPVNQSIHVRKGNNDFTLTVTVQQAPQ
jgi:hypothetical protein